MALVTGLALIVCGVLAASSLVVKMQPNARHLVDKLAPYQGWIGVIVGAWGAWAVVQAVLWVRLVSIVPVYWTTYLATGVLELALGFLLGYGLVVKYALSGNEAAMTRGADVQQRLTAVQVPLGVAGMVVGAWCIASGFIWSVA